MHFICEGTVLWMYCHAKQTTNSPWSEPLNDNPLYINIPQVVSKLQNRGQNMRSEKSAVFPVH